MHRAIITIIRRAIPWRYGRSSPRLLRLLRRSRHSRPPLILRSLHIYWPFEFKDHTNRIGVFDTKSHGFLG